MSVPVAAQTPPAENWRQWGGTHRNFIVESTTRLAESWPDAGPPLRWSRPLGTGHSAILFDEGRLYTLYRVGNARARQGPFDAEEVVVALDAQTGRTLWEHKYPSRREDFSFGAGPHATPLIVGDRLFTAGTNKQLFAFDKRTGKVLWSHDLIAEFGSPELLIRPVVKTGYGCSPIAFRDTIICSVGGPGQSVMAFRQSDGAVVWKSGDFLTSEAAPILIEFAGEPQLVFLAGGTITGIDPLTGAVLWSHPHDPGNDLNCNTPLWGPDNILFVSSAYKAGSRAIRLKKDGERTIPEELWFSNRVRFMFLNALRLGGYIYGTTGDFGPAFLTALDVQTGQAAWQHRGFGRASLVHADGKTIIMDEDGDLALARLTPQGATILAQAKIFETTSWTVPTLAGTMLYARDRERIVAIELGDPAAAATSKGAAADAGTDRRAEAVTAGPANGGGGADGARRDGAAKAPVVTASPSSARAKVAAPVASRAGLAGTWKLDAAQSRIDPAAGLVGLIGAGAPPMLHITEAANGDVIVESPINEGHARMYRPGAETTTPIGQGGTVAATAAWLDQRLVSTGMATTAGGAQSRVREAYAASADRETLLIEVTATAAEEKRSTLRYARIRSVGGCETWPTPCKRAP